MNWLQVWAFMNAIGDLLGWILILSFVGFVAWAVFLAKMSYRKSK